MIKPLRDDRDLPSKEECITPTAKASTRRRPPAAAAATTATNPRLWLGLKDPRIVRVSRAFGGKDRHSKVTTVKGLRDRRIRLSVQTAIQLYDLQDRLGLNQPSKVVDWLLNAAQHEIDKLPPLPIMPSSFTQFGYNPVGEHGYHDHTNPSHHHHRHHQQQQHPATTLSIANASTLEYAVDNWKPDAPRPVGGRIIHIDDGSATVAHRALAAVPTSSAAAAAAAIYASYYNLEPSNSGNSGMGPFMSQAEETSHGWYRQQNTESLSLLPGSQLMFCTSGTMPSMFQSYAHQVPQTLFPNSLPAAFHSVVSTEYGLLKAPEVSKPQHK